MSLHTASTPRTEWFLWQMYAWEWEVTEPRREENGIPWRTDISVAALSRQGRVSFCRPGAGEAHGYEALPPSFGMLRSPLPVHNALLSCGGLVGCSFSLCHNFTCHRPRFYICLPAASSPQPQEDRDSFSTITSLLSVLTRAQRRVQSLGWLFSYVRLSRGHQEHAHCHVGIDPLLALVQKPGDCVTPSVGVSKDSFLSWLLSPRTSESTKARNQPQTPIPEDTRSVSETDNPLFKNPVQSQKVHGDHERKAQGTACRRLLAASGTCCRAGL